MIKSKLEEEQEWIDWQKSAPQIYEEIYYKTNPIVSMVNNRGHYDIESSINPSEYYKKIVEVGGGTGFHFKYVKHKFDEYHLTDINDSLLNEAKINLSNHPNYNKVIFSVQNALSLNYSDNSFDRLISAYNLEHLTDPRIALKEWKRVVKPGGLISISIPTEGGLMWNLGRHLTTRRYFKSKGLNLDYIISREHINACYRLKYLIDYYFPQKQNKWFPFLIPSTNFNLLYTASCINLK